MRAPAAIEMRCFTPAILSRSVADDKARFRLKAEATAA
jgi:hypothetical protein